MSVVDYFNLCKDMFFIDQITAKNY